MSLRTFFTILLTVVASITTDAQVTIGSTIPPLPGSLLDLKEHEADILTNVTSTKGLGMPRVALTSPKALTDILTNPIPTDLDTHIGLLVYNTTTSVYFCPGLYVWDGGEWMPIPEPEPIPDTAMTDGDGNVYGARWYGSECRGAYWMTNNLYTTTKGDGAVFTEPVLKMNPAKSSSLDIVNVSTKADIPDSGTTIAYNENNITKNDTYFAFAQKFGLLYSWHQAMEACPTGWHLATVDDWDILAEILGGKVDENNNYLLIGQQFKANDYIYMGNDTNVAHRWGGNDVLGFKGYPSGCVDSKDLQITASNFGIHAYWWTSDKGANNPNLAIDVGVHHDQTALYRGENYPEYFFSARCVKDK